jgi:peptide/nickel transport system substrate-binding protein
VKASIEAKGPQTVVEFVLKNAYAPLLVAAGHGLTGMAAIMAKETLAQPLKEFVGTGPYQFKERKPDQYVLLTRFDGYAARSGSRQRLRRQAHAPWWTSCVSCRCPTPTRASRVRAGRQFHYADLLPIEALGRLEKAAARWCRS